MKLQEREEKVKLDEFKMFERLRNLEDWEKLVLEREKILDDREKIFNEKDKDLKTWEKEFE